MTRLSGIWIEVSDEQLEKAESPISASLLLSFMFTKVKLVHPVKALSPIWITLSGILIEVNDEQLEKAEFPISASLLFSPIRMM